MFYPREQWGENQKRNLDRDPIFSCINSFPKTATVLVIYIDKHTKRFSLQNVYYRCLCCISHQVNNDNNNNDNNNNDNNNNDNNNNNNNNNSFVIHDKYCSIIADVVVSFEKITIN